MKRSNNVRLRILDCLVKIDKPLILSHIAKRLKSSPQSIAYQLSNMVKDGILLKNELCEYYPQGYFMNENMYELFYDQVEQFVLFINDSTIVVQMESDNTVNIFKMFIDIFFKKMNGISKTS